MPQSAHVNELYHQLSDRQKRKNIHYNSVGRQPTSSSAKKQMNRQMSYSSTGLPSNKKLADQKLQYLKIQNNYQRVMNYKNKNGELASANKSSASKHDKYSSQERVLKMAEDERDLLDEMILVNQQHKKEVEMRKQKMVAMPQSNAISPSRPSHVRATQSPIGYPTQVSQNTMITLNNKNLGAQPKPKQLIKVPKAAVSPSAFEGLKNA